MQLDDDLEPVLADFALSRLTTATLTTFSETVGTCQVALSWRGKIAFVTDLDLQWMAPELLDNEPRLTQKIDVYSYGIVLWELMSGQVRLPLYLGSCWCSQVVAASLCDLHQSGPGCFSRTEGPATSAAAQLGLAVLYLARELLAPSA
jgi:serine/threonine protein kinase